MLRNVALDDFPKTNCMGGYIVVESRSNILLLRMVALVNTKTKKSAENVLDRKRLFDFQC